ncbi:MAG TPA: hypothetical protein VFP72_18325 [Kineosporiaceae bacterium]|nr:hypothetical protein [Kineosporiaceae bacterium]
MRQLDKYTAVISPEFDDPSTITCTLIHDRHAGVSGPIATITCDTTLDAVVAEILRQGFTVTGPWQIGNAYDGLRLTATLAPRPASRPGECPACGHTAEERADLMAKATPNRIDPESGRSVYIPSSVCGLCGGPGISQYDRVPATEDKGDCPGLCGCGMAVDEQGCTEDRTHPVP